MTTDKVAAIDIPTGKAVERIEAKEIDGKIAITVLYKEDKPKKNKPVAVLCETDAHTCLYRDKRTETIVMFRPDHYKPDTARYVPVRSAKAGEFVVFRQDAHSAAMQDLIVIEDNLSILASGDVAVELRQIVNIAMRLRGLRYFLEEQSK